MRTEFSIYAVARSGGIRWLLALAGNRWLSSVLFCTLRGTCPCLMVVPLGVLQMTCRVCAVLFRHIVHTSGIVCTYPSYPCGFERHFALLLIFTYTLGLLTLSSLHSKNLNSNFVDAPLLTQYLCQATCTQKPQKGPK